MRSLQSLLVLTTMLLLSNRARASPMPASSNAAQLENLEARAGAPIVTRTIPSDCHTSAPFASATASSNPQYTPALAIPTLYSYFLLPDDATVQSQTHEQLFAHCLDTCFNYGETWNFTAPDNGGKCRAAWMAFDVVNPFDTSIDAARGVQCLMFNRTMDAGDFELVSSGTVGAEDSRAVDLGCPQC